MTVRALAPAEADLLAAAGYLNGERPGVGDRLVDQYERVLATVERLPQLYPLVDDEVPEREFRNAILTRFRYRVVYEVRPDEVVVVAVAHTSLHPTHWHARVADPT